ncbi:MAG TPA: VTT domain-containing protein [Burkholderiales bacterium]
MPEAQATDTLFEIGENCCAVKRSNRVALLVDAESYFEAFMRAAERAERSIVVLAWDFNSRTPLRIGPDGERLLLGDFLNGLARRRRRLHVRVLDWDYPMVFGVDRELPPLYGLSWTPHRRVHLRYDGTHPLAGSHHQKIVVIDDRLAFVGGLDLTARRWDTSGHAPGDPRRIASGKAYPPFHDVMIAVDGEAAASLAEIARKRWRLATHSDIPRVARAGDPWPDSLRPDMTDVDVGVACTAPETSGEKGVRDVERLYLDMIARARRSIYVENQYFTSHTIGEALAARLAEPDGPEIVIVTRLLSHGWLEEMTMQVLRTRLIQALKQVDRYQHFHVYYPDIDGLAEGTCIDVHSKLMVVDDEWLRVGSANLSNRSMGLDTECDVVVEAGARPELRRAVSAFRDRLLAEHTGAEAADVAREIERSGGMAAAVAKLSTGPRRLRPLDDLKDWPEAVVEAIAVADPERPVSLDQLADEFAQDEVVRERRHVGRNAAIVAFVLLALGLAWRYTPLAEVATPEAVLDWFDRFSGHWWAPLALLAAYTPASLVMFPRPLITLATVIAYGPWTAFAFSIAGNVIAACVVYAAGRKFGRDTVRRIAGERLNRLCSLLQRRGLLAVVAVRLVPVAPFVVENVVGGAVRIRFWQFAVGTAIGHVPGTLATTVFGSQIEAALREPGNINWWLVGAATVLLGAAILAMRRWLGRLESREKAREPVRRRAAERALLARQHAELGS